jgi:hypothetical protein
MQAISRSSFETVWETVYACRDYYDSVLLREPYTFKVQALILAVQRLFQCSLEEREAVIQQTIGDMNKAIRQSDDSKTPDEDMKLVKFACNSISQRLKQMTDRTCVPYCHALFNKI